MQRCKEKSEGWNNYSEEFDVNVGVHQESVLSPLLFAIIVDVVTKEIKEGMLQVYCTWMILS